MTENKEEGGEESGDSEKNILEIVMVKIFMARTILVRRRRTSLKATRKYEKKLNDYWLTKYSISLFGNKFIIN